MKQSFGGGSEVGVEEQQINGMEDVVDLAGALGMRTIVTPRKEDLAEAFSSLAVEVLNLEDFTATKVG